MPAPSEAFLVSTKFPMWTRSVEPGPRSEVGEWADARLGADFGPARARTRSGGATRSRHVASTRKAVPSIRHPSPIVVRPRSWTFGPMMVSRPMVTSGPMYAVAGSSNVTPASIQRSTAVRLTRSSILASSIRVFIPATSSGRPAWTERTRRPARAAMRHDVREVQLALRVVRAELGKKREENLRADRVQPRVDLGDGALAGGRVTLLDDAGDLPLRITKDSAIALRLLKEHGHQRDVGILAPMGGEQRLERLATDERHVAVEDQHVAAEADEGVGRAGDGMPGPTLLRL